MLLAGHRALHCIAFALEISRAGAHERARLASIKRGVFFAEIFTVIAIGQGLFADTDIPIFGIASRAVASAIRGLFNLLIGIALAT